MVRLGWVTVDELLECIEARLDREEPAPELTAYATQCAAEIDAKWEEALGG